MSFYLISQHEERTLEALFKPLFKFLKSDRLNSVPNATQLKAQLAGILHGRLRHAIKQTPVRSAIASALMIDEQSRMLMEQIVSSCDAGEEVKSWLGPCVEYANFLFNVLVGGATTKYPDVDSPIYLDNDCDYEDFLAHICGEWISSHTMSPCNMSPLYDWFHFAALIHQANKDGRLTRNLALQKNRNTTVFRAVKRIDWNAKPFTAVLILGQSPAVEGQKLSPLSKEKLRRAVAENMGDRLAPIYIGCGGTVRPQGTEINEADEMKKCAIDEFGVREERFAIEATSEHTYSNFMHAAMLGAAMGMPHRSRMITFPHATQRAFIKEKMTARANEEVFPPFATFGYIEEGEIHGSIVFTLNVACKDMPISTTLRKNMSF
jgi:hypothetical protein